MFVLCMYMYTCHMCMHVIIMSMYVYGYIMYLSWRSGKRPRLRVRRVKVRFSLRAIILSLENLNVVIRAIN